MIINQLFMRTVAIRHFLTAVIFCLFLSACMTTGQQGGAILSVGNSPAGIGSVPEELQARHQNVLDLYGGTYQNPALETYIAQIMSRLIAASEDIARPFRLTLLDSAEINAFALSDSHLYITRGLITLANDESELASVIAHEMAHLTLGHSHQRQERTRTKDIVQQVMADVLQKPADHSSDTMQLAYFSQRQEIAADANSIRLIAKAGYDPYANARFLTSLDRFQKFQTIQGSDTRQNIASHPSTPERVKAARLLARQLGAPGIGEKQRDRYLKVLNGIPYGDSGEDSIIKGTRYSDRNTAFTFTLPTSFVLEKTDNGLLASDKNDLALRYDREDHDSHSSLSAAIMSGWIGQIDPEQIKSVSIAGFDGLQARTVSDQWVFHIIILDDGKNLHRFVMTTKASKQDQLGQLTDHILKNTRALTWRDKGLFEPAKVTIATYSSESELNKRLQTGAMALFPEGLFYILNGFEHSEKPSQGQLIKLIQ
jgi:predicted Zn-dependent protease